MKTTPNFTMIVLAFLIGIVVGTIGSIFPYKDVSPETRHRATCEWALNQCAYSAAQSPNPEEGYKVCVSAVWNGTCK